MINKDGSIVIGAANFQKGQADSPHVGMGAVRNVDVLNVPGIARMAYRTNLLYSTVGLPTAIVRDVYGNTYVGTENGYLYKNGVVLQSGLTQVYDLKIYKDYLFVSHSNRISLYGPLNTAPAWVSNWSLGLSGGSGGLASGYNHPLIAGRDDIVYVGNGNKVASIASFTAAATPTATYTDAALTLPSGIFVRTMTELGTYLVVGTQLGSSFYDFSYGLGNIYFWDRTSTSFDGNPLLFLESGINQILTVGNDLWVQAGIYGNIYKTNRASFAVERNLPYNYQKTSTIFPYPNAIGKLGDEIVFGTSTLSDAFPGSLSTHGVFNLKDKISTLRNVISTGNYGSSQNLKIGAISSLNSSSYKYMLIGWQDGSSYGVDEIDSRTYVSSAVMESQLYEVGSPTNRKTYNSIEYSLARPLVSGQSIALKYRLNLTDDWTTIGTYTTSNTMSGKVSHIAPANIADAEMIQLRVELAQPVSAVFGNNVELREVRLRI